MPAGRPKQQFCKNGHDTLACGRDDRGYCRQCRRCKVGNDMIDVGQTYDEADEVRPVPEMKHVDVIRLCPNDVVTVRVNKNNIIMERPVGKLMTSLYGGDTFQTTRERASTIPVTIVDDPVAREESAYRNRMESASEFTRAGA